MRLRPRSPARRFRVGEVAIDHVADLTLEPDEQVTFVAATGSELDVVRKPGGTTRRPRSTEGSPPMASVRSSCAARTAAPGCCSSRPGTRRSSTATARVRSYMSWPGSTPRRRSRTWRTRSCERGCDRAGADEVRARPGQGAATQLAGRPLLGHLLDRLCTLGMPLVVATSDDRSDDAIAALLRGRGRGRAPRAARRRRGALRRRRPRARDRPDRARQRRLAAARSGARATRAQAVGARAAGHERTPALVPHRAVGRGVRAGGAGARGADAGGARARDEHALRAPAGEQLLAHRPTCRSCALRSTPRRTRTRLDALFARMDRPPADYSLAEVVDLCSG